MRIRPIAPKDLSALYEIALLTGDAGGDATALHAQPRLIGEIYAAPYAVLAPELALVLDDDLGMAGYVVGVADTAAFEARLEREWWPKLRKLYPDPGGDPSTWNADQRRAYLIHHPWPAPADVVSHYPAHLHMNLHPRAQGRGEGARLLGAWLERARSLGIAKVHLGTNAANGRAAAFWARQGFQRLERPRARGRSTLWFGKILTDRD